MEKVKENFPKIVIGTAIGALSAYIMYKLVQRQGVPAGSSHSDPLIEAIDPRSSITVKNQEAHDLVVSYIHSRKGTFVERGGKLPKEEFNQLQRIMNFYAKAILFDKKISS